VPNKCTGEVMATVPLADVAVTHEAIAAAAREGVRFAMEDMTTIKMVVINHN